MPPSSQAEFYEAFAAHDQWLWGFGGVGGGARFTARKMDWTHARNIVMPASLAGADFSDMPNGFGHAEFAGVDLTGVDFTGSRLDGTCFAGANLTRATLDRITLAKPKKNEDRAFVFKDANLTGVTLRNVDLTGCLLEGTILDEAVLEGCDLSGSVLLAASLRAAEFSRVKAHGAILDKVRAVGMSWTLVDATGIHLVDCDLDGILLSKVAMVAARVRGGNLRGARMFGSGVWDSGESQVKDLSLEEAAFIGTDLDGVLFQRMSAPGLRLIGCRAAGADFSGSDLLRLRIIGGNFDVINLSGVRASEAVIRNASMKGALLKGAKFNHAVLQNVGLRDAVLDKVDLDYSILGTVDLAGTGAETFGASFRKADLKDVIFKGRGLRAVVFAGSTLKRVDFAECDQYHCDYTEADGAGVTMISKMSWNVKLEKASFRDSDFSGCYFTERCSLRDGNFSGCNFARARFHGADLSGGLFVRADLSGAEVAGYSTFKGTDLAGANLEGTRFEFIDLRETVLTGTLLADTPRQDLTMLYKEVTRPQESLDVGQLMDNPGRPSPGSIASPEV